MPESSRSPSPAVVITGASTGIGAACALELDRRDFRVFAGVRSEADAQRLQQQASSRLIALRIDVTDQASIAAAAETIGAAVGPVGLAGVVNNAGIVVAGPIEWVPLGLLRRQFEVNVIGQVAVIQAMAPLLRAGRGRVVQMSSISGFVAAPYLGPYAASKHALEAISDCLRVELRHAGISVSIIEPGSVKTPIWDKAISSVEDIRKGMPPEAAELYDADMEAMDKARAHLAATGMPVECVVRAVVHALTARRPKTRYPVGVQTRLAAVLWRFLADKTRDWFLCRDLGLR